MCKSIVRISSFCISSLDIAPSCNSPCCIWLRYQSIIGSISSIRGYAFAGNSVRFGVSLVIPNCLYNWCKMFLNIRFSISDDSGARKLYILAILVIFISYEPSSVSSALLICKGLSLPPSLPSRYTTLPPREWHTWVKSPATSITLR